MTLRSDSTWRWSAATCSLAIVRAAESLTRLAFGDAVAALEPIVDSVSCLGGSSIQQELFEDTLLYAYLRAGDSSAAAAKCPNPQPLQ